MDFPFAVGVRCPFSPAQVPVQQPVKPVDAEDSWLIFSSITACFRHHLHLTVVLIVSYNWAFAGIRGQNGVSVYPKDKMFEVNSTVTFCCIVPEGNIFSEMSPHSRYKGTILNSAQISEHVHTLTLRLDHESENWNDIECKTTGGDSGASFHAGCKFEL